MKKINVSKLIDLRTRENDIVYSQGMNHFDFTRKNLQDQLAEIRAQFAAESEALTAAIAAVEGPRVSVRKIDAKEIVDDLIAINDYLGITKRP